MEQSLLKLLNSFILKKQDKWKTPIRLALIWDVGMLGMRLVVFQEAREDLKREQKVYSQTMIYQAKSYICFASSYLYLFILQPNPILCNASFKSEVYPLNIIHLKTNIQGPLLLLSTVAELFLL